MFGEGVGGLLCHLGGSAVELPNRKSQGPVTLVVDRQGDGAGLLSWTFGNLSSAEAVAHALQKHDAWVLVQGAFGSATLALEAARTGARLTSSSDGSQLMRKCQVPESAADTDKHRSSA